MNECKNVGAEVPLRFQKEKEKAVAFYLLNTYVLVCIQTGFQFSENNRKIAC